MRQTSNFATLQREWDATITFCRVRHRRTLPSLVRNGANKGGKEVSLRLHHKGISNFDNTCPARQRKFPFLDALAHTIVHFFNFMQICTYGRLNLLRRRGRDDHSSSAEELVASRVVVVEVCVYDDPRRPAADLAVGIRLGVYFVPMSPIARLLEIKSKSVEHSHNLNFCNFWQLQSNLFAQLFQPQTLSESLKLR